MISSTVRSGENRILSPWSGLGGLSRNKLAPLSEGHLNLYLDPFCTGGLIDGPLQQREVQVEKIQWEHYVVAPKRGATAGCGKASRIGSFGSTET